MNAGSHRFESGGYIDRYWLRNVETARHGRNRWADHGKAADSADFSLIFYVFYRGGFKKASLQ